MSKKVTAEEAYRSYKDKYESINIQKGHLRVNKTWMKVCAGIGVASAAVGCSGIILTGFTLVPVATVGLGIAAASVSGYFHHNNNKELDALDREYSDSRKKEIKIEDKENAKVAAKVKTR